MGSTCVVGLQWGDEAKGKIVDLLCDQHDVVVRYQGGPTPGIRLFTRGSPTSSRWFPRGSSARESNASSATAW